MSSLPSWVASAFDFSRLLSTAATMAPPTRNDTGNTMTVTITTMIGPKSTATFLSGVGPRFDFDQRADRQLGDTDGGARRTVIAELVDVDLVHQRVVVHVPQEHGRLRDVRERRAVGFEMAAQV